MGNLGAQKEKRNDTPISAKKDIMGDKTVRVRADLHHIIKIETAKNGGNVKEVMEIRLRSKLKSVLIVHYLKTFSQRIDDALTLYSQGGIGDVLAPSWHKSKQKFNDAYHEISNYLFSDSPNLLTDPSTPIEQKKDFVKQYQRFDKAFAAVQTYDEFDEVDPAKDYQLSQENLDAMQGTYETLVEQLKDVKDDDDDSSEPVDTEYELESVIDKSVNYQYILGLIQAYVPDEGELLPSAGQKETAEIEGYISDLSKTNKPLATIVSQLWDKIKQHPENYAGQQVDQLLNKMIDQAYNQELMAFADKYHVSLDDLKFVIKNYDVHASKQAGVNQMLTRDAFKRFKEANADSELKRMMDWKKQVRSQLNDLYINHIEPLLDN